MMAPHNRIHAQTFVEPGSPGLPPATANADPLCTINRLQLELAEARTAHLALNEEVSHYRLLYEQNPSMYFTLEPGGGILSVNQFGANALGYRPDELIGQSVLQVFDPVDHQTVLTQLLVCADSPGTVFDWEIQKTRKDGSRLWVKERARWISDPQGRPIILIVCEDITDRRKAETAMRESERRLQDTTQFLDALIREAPLPIVSLDANGIVTSWNQAATTLFGWSAHEVLGRELPYVTPGQEHEANILWEEGVRKKVRGPLSLSRRRKDGTQLDLLLWPVFFDDASGHLASAVGFYVDRSDVQRAEAARRHSELRLQSFLNALDDLAFELDREGTYLNVWTRNDDKLLHPKNHIIGKRVQEILPASQSAQVMTLIEQVLSTGHPAPIEYSLMIQGQLHHFNAIMSRIPASSITEATVACLVRDISELRQTEATLREHQARLDFLVSQSPAMIYTAEVSGAYGATFVSANVTAQLGYTPDEFTSEPRFWIEHLHPDDTPMVLAALPRLFTDDTITHEYRFLDKQGRYRWMRDQLILIRDDQGHPKEAVGSWFDITERKLAEEALRTSEERFSKAFRSSPYPVIVTEQATGRCLEVNDAGLALFGYQRNEVVGHRMLDLGVWPHPDDRAAFFARLAQEGCIRNLEVQFVAKDGSPRLCLVSCEPIEIGGIPCLLAVGHDITKQKRATALLTQEFRVLEMMAQNTSLPTVLEALCALLEQQNPQLRCSVLLLDTREQRLHSGVAPSLPADYLQAINGLRIGPQVGSCGSAAYLGETVIVSDIETDPRWTPYCELARLHGLAACWSMPIKDASGHVLGTFAIYHPSPCHPTQDDLALMERATHLAGLAIAKIQARQERERFSQDLHDNTLQSLYAVGMQLEAAKLVASTSTRKTKTHITKAIDQLNRLVAEMRLFITLLHTRPEPVTDLSSALRQLVASFTSEVAAARLHIEPAAAALIPPDIGEQLLNIVREALSNSLRHARAKHRSVTLRTAGEAVELSVCDNGIGFTPSRRQRTGHGLANMAARAKHIHARFSLTSAPGQGTCITVLIPRSLHS